MMLGFMSKKKNDSDIFPYDPEIHYPVIRSSICTGEKVAGFKEKATGHMTEVMTIRNDKDIEGFKEMYGIEGDIKTEY